MKKFTSILLILLCCTCIFAIKSNVSVAASPLCMQCIKTSELEESRWSSYGFGLKATYKGFVWENVYSELGLDWNLYFFKGEKLKSTHILGFAGAGYKYDINKVYTAFAHLDVGADTIISDKAETKNLSLIVGLGLSYALNEKWSLDCSIDGTFGFARKSERINRQQVEIKGSTYRITPAFGATWSF